MTGSPAAAIPRAVAFDWGGVFTRGTFDSSAVRALAGLVGMPVEELEPTYLDLMVDFEAGRHDLPGFHRRFSEATDTATQLDVFRRTFLGAVRERPETYALVAALPPGVRLGILSNNVAELCDAVRADPRLARFEAFLFSNELGVRKPDPAAYQALIDALGEEPGATVFVDDNPGNVDAASRFGLRAVLFDSHFPERFARLFPGVALPGAFGQPGWR
ncbi:MAG TPA: HAD family phosphatase [Trueperaceae bacterium]